MDHGTIVFIALGAIGLLALVAHEIRTWRRPGKKITGTPGHDNAAVNENAIRNNGLGGIGAGIGPLG